KSNNINQRHALPWVARPESSKGVLDVLRVAKPFEGNSPAASEQPGCWRTHRAPHSWECSSGGEGGFTPMPRGQLWVARPEALRRAWATCIVSTPFEDSGRATRGHTLDHSPLTYSPLTP